MAIASLPMYDFPELRWATEAVWGGIAARVPGAPARLERGRALHEVWTDPGLLLGQTCGYPLMTALAGRVAVVMTPRYRAAGCEGFLYRSAIVVRAGDEAASLAGLRGRRCAVNSLDSHSGMNVLRAEIAPLAGDGERFFGGVVMTGGHAASVAAVASGAADVAAIDCVTWAHLQRLRPAETQGLRVLGWTVASPGLPLITSVHTDAATVRRLAEALEDVARDPGLAPARDALLLDGFASVPIETYESILALERRAQDLGYPVLQ